MNPVAGRRFALDDRVVLVGLLVLAALLRLPDLATRGTWDGDQGHDMLVLREFVEHGVVPLLGPPTSIGDIHHGAWYYYLLSPAAALTGGDQPLAVVAEIALGGIAAVGVTWWLGRSIGGPLVGAVAGLLLAVSAAAIDGSTFIWNPNLIALSSAVALAAAWRAWSGHRPAWWAVAAIGTAITMQCHILGAALLPIVGAPLVLDARRRSLGRVPVAILAVFVLAYLPLAIHELTSGFGELHAATDYLAAGGGSGDLALPVRIGIVALRVVSWPLTGLIIDGFGAAALASVGLVTIVIWAWRAGTATERPAARWFGLGLLWTVVALSIVAPSLATVVRGLPNDHYHAFADPMVVVLTGIGIAALATRLRAPFGPLAAGVVLVALVGWNTLHLPPAVSPDGGFPAGQAAADRVDGALSAAGINRTALVELRSLPAFKSTEALAYPLVRLGRAVQAATPDGVAPGSTLPGGVPDAVVLLCDQLFRDSIGADCGGAAEDAFARVNDVAGGLLDRFEAAPGRWMSIYRLAAG